MTSDNDNGCTCQGCGVKYKVDVCVQDTLWQRIKPIGKPDGAGLLCGVCIFSRIDGLGRFGAFQLTEIK